MIISVREIGLNWLQFSTGWRNYGYPQQPAANKRTSGVHLSKFCFHTFNFVSSRGVQNALFSSGLRTKNSNEK